MNIRSSKIVTGAIILLGALAMLGATGAISPASAAAVVINSDAKVTNYAQVTLTVTPPAGSIDNIEMRLQNESNTPSAWQDFAATTPWTLSAGTGVKTVSVQFRDKTTKISIPPAVADTIIFDSIIDTSFNAASATYPGTANYVNTASLLTSATAANAVAVYPDTGPNAGKTVTVGTFDNGDGNTDIKIVRYNADGTLDIQYVFDHAGFADSGNAVAIQPDGKIVVVGTCSSSNGVTDICVLRLNSNGTLDAGFGVNGVIDYIATGKDSGNAVAIDPTTNNIVVAGTHNSDLPSAWVLRFNTAGAKDATFGGQGDVAYFGGTANAVVVQEDQQIVVVGTHINGVNDTSAWVMRLNSDGTEDASFNQFGSSPGNNFFGTAGLHSGNAVAIDPETENIVIVGTYNGSQAWIIQLTEDGTLDPGFNYVGNVAFEGPVATRGNAVAIQTDGKIVMVGTSDLGNGSTSVLVARINNSGTLDDTLLDTSFNNGSYDYTFGTSAKFAGRAVALQPDGKIVVTGIGDAHRVLSSIPSGSTSMLTLRLFDKTADFSLFFPLSVSVTGVGTVSSVPGTISCTNASGPGCSESFTAGTLVTLTATPTWYTLSGLWSGACSGSIATACTVTMDMVRNVNATFISNMNARVVGWGDYPTLTEAYSVANDVPGSIATIQAKNILFPMMSFNLPVTVTLEGGKGSDFSAAAVGFTSITGPLNISNGRLNASNLKVKQP